jgi:hypothetical protein
MIDEDARCSQAVSGILPRPPNHAILRFFFGMAARTILFCAIVTCGLSCIAGKVRAQLVNSLDSWFLASALTLVATVSIFDGIARFADRMGSAESKDCRGWVSCVVRANGVGAAEKARETKPTVFHVSHNGIKP